MPLGLRRVDRAAHRARPSDPPPRATELGRPAVGPLAVRMRPRQRHPTQGARSVLARGGERRLTPEGRDWPAPPAVCWLSRDHGTVGLPQDRRITTSQDR